MSTYIFFWVFYISCIKKEMLQLQRCKLQLCYVIAGVLFCPIFFATLLMDLLFFSFYVLKYQ